MTSPITSALPPLGDEIWYDDSVGSQWKIYRLGPDYNSHPPAVAISVETGEVYACIGEGYNLSNGIHVPTIEFNPGFVNKHTHRKVTRFNSVQECREYLIALAVERKLDGS